MTERTVSFTCQGNTLHGILHAAPAATARRGLVIVVGGPQYRVGSHRQFVLLARHLAAHGIPVLRFDYRGMGDSEGRLSHFQQIGEDIRAAIDCLRAEHAVEEVVLWGLCDAASASCFYACSDPRVAGLVLLNPWVRTEAGEAKAVLRHYYLQRLTDAELWRRVLGLELDWRRSLTDLARAVRSALRRGKPPGDGGDGPPDDATLPQRMLFGLARFSGPVLVILSGRDLTAREFEDTLKQVPAWRSWAQRPGVDRRDLPEADHTFSRRAWRDRVADWTLEWMRSW